MKSFLIVLLLHSIAMCCYVAVCCHVKTFNACHKTNTNITINEGDCPLIVWTICSDDGSILITGGHAEGDEVTDGGAVLVPYFD